MKTLTKVLAGAAAGYAFRAYLKRDVLSTNEALKHSVDRRLSVEGYYNVPLTKPTFIERQVERLGDKVYNWTYNFLYNNYRPDPGSRYDGHFRFERKGRN